MDENTQNLESQEEQNAENEATKEVPEDELRTKLVEDLGIDPEENQELLDKLIEREKANHEKLSTAIKQKITWRDKAKTSTTEKPSMKEPKGDKSKNQEVDIDALVDARFEALIQTRDLKSMNLPEEVETEVRDLAKIRGISVREASELPYIKSRLDEIEKEKRTVIASPKRSKKGSVVTSSIDYSKPLNPDDFMTNDGNMDVKAWNEARDARRRYLSSNK